MSRFNSVISAEAWDSLVTALIQARGENEDETLDDSEIAELVRNRIFEVEGEEI